MPGKTTREKASKHETLMPLLQAMHKEFQGATNKKPDTVVSVKKVKIANRLLSDVKKILSGEPEDLYVDILDEDDLPQNSDVSLIIGQAVAAMQAFRDRYFGYDEASYSHKWFIK